MVKKATYQYVMGTVIDSEDHPYSSFLIDQDIVQRRRKPDLEGIQQENTALGLRIYEKQRRQGLYKRNMNL